MADDLDQMLLLYASVIVAATIALCLALANELDYERRQSAALMRALYYEAERNTPDGR